MRILYILLLITFCSLKGYSQLTKSETIKYLNTRIAETKGLVIHYNQERTYTMSNFSLFESTKYKNKLILSYSRTFADGAADQLEYAFDPTHITGFIVPKVNYDDAVGTVQVQFAGLVLITKQTTKGSVRYLDGDKFIVPFLRAEQLNEERVKKALMHLKKLYQDATPLDPFVN